MLSATQTLFQIKPEEMTGYIQQHLIATCLLTYVTNGIQDFVKCCIERWTQLDLRPDNKLFGGLQPVESVCRYRLGKKSLKNHFRGTHARIYLCLLPVASFFPKPHIHCTCYSRSDWFSYTINRFIFTRGFGLHHWSIEMFHVATCFCLHFGQQFSSCLHANL